MMMMMRILLLPLLHLLPLLLLLLKSFVGVFVLDGDVIVVGIIATAPPGVVAADTAVTADGYLLSYLLVPLSSLALLLWLLRVLLPPRLMPLLLMASGLLRSPSLLMR